LAPYTDDEGRHDDVGHAVAPRCFQHRHGSVALTWWVAMGSASDRGHRRAGGQMDDRLGPLDDPVEIVRAQDGALTELEPMGSRPEFWREPVEQVVQSHHVVDEVLAVEHPAEVSHR